MGGVWDYVSDGWDNVKDYWGDAWDYVSRKVGEFSAVVIEYFAEVVGYIFPGLDEVIYELAEINYDIWDEVGEYVKPVIQVVLAYWGVPYQVSGAMVDSYTTMLEEIHVEQMKQISDIEIEITDEWILAIAQIDREIEQVSQNNYRDPHFLTLVLRITRNKVLEVSNLLGRPYIVSELEWIGQLHKILGMLRIPPLWRNPSISQLFALIDEVIYKPYCDTKGKLSLSWFTLFEGLLNASYGLNESTEKVKDALAKVIDGLPGQIKNEVQPLIDDHRNEVGEWIQLIYHPELTNIRDLIDVLTGQTNTHTQNIQGIVDRIVNPGDYLYEIDERHPDVIEDQEDKVTDISHRRYARDSDALSAEASDTYDHLDDLVDAGQVPVEVKPWNKPLVAKVKPKTIDPMEKRTTWFVGDF